MLPINQSYKIIIQKEMIFEKCSVCISKYVNQISDNVIISQQSNSGRQISNFPRRLNLLKRQYILSCVFCLSTTQFS